ncbi:hypothetical protein [Umezawaea sp. Da 62-37]|uniref:hypothetical protein n=1 Tax=Umezawaea sp. Da 62-37 TaxID=3075927 RepID=UPI0028F73B4F|nr:hypothetical protein [Umezawaea sp. Da 62-37]WNV83181.1 hypothetical protein RM788_34040 [Umezawaea sp. Da 62-37]
MYSLDTLSDQAATRKNKAGSFAYDTAIRSVPLHSMPAGMTTRRPLAFRDRVILRIHVDLLLMLWPDSKPLWLLGADSAAGGILRIRSSVLRDRAVSLLLAVV